MGQLVDGVWQDTGMTPIHRRTIQAFRFGLP